VTIGFGPKAIAELFNSDYGRMSAMLGVELPFTNGGNQTTIDYKVMDPVTEILNDAVTVSPVTSATDGTQLWKITHNGVDTHPIHFHLFNVQLVNRVGWDGSIRPPDPNELGWKDTVKFNPLEDAIVALRPVAPKAPFGQPDSIRPLDPTMPIGATAGFKNVDPTTGSPIVVTNQLYNFGWEYVWHCHILSHEEMDMMRPIQFNVARALAAAPVLSAAGSSGSPVALTWTDGTPAATSLGNPANEIGFRIERVTGATGGTFAAIGNALANQTSFTDGTTVAGTTYRYRVVAFNAAGDSTSNEVVAAPSAPPPAAPTTLVAALQTGPQVQLTWQDNATNETGFVIERATNGGAFAQIAAPGPRTGTGSVSYTDTTVTAGNTYAYRVKAVNGSVSSAYSNTVTVTVPPVPAAPTSLVAALQTGPRVQLTWQDNATNEAGFVIERATNGGAFAQIAAPGSRAGTGSVIYTDTTVTAGNTYVYQVKAVNGVVSSAYTNTVSVAVPLPPPPAAPTSLIAAVQTGPRVQLTWQDNATGETGFVVERAANGGAFAQIAAPGPRTGTGNVSYTDTTVTAGNTYTYRVKAVNGLVSSTYSNTVSAAVLLPAAPSSLRVTAARAGFTDSVTLNWTDNANNETSFTIQRSTNATFTANVINTNNVPANAVTYTQTGVSRTTTFYYRIRAVNSVGTSAWSNVVNVTTP
jgi:hypothetical protein